MYVFKKPFARTGCDTRSIFKRSLTGSNSEVSFSETGCLTKFKKPSLPYYLLIAGGKTIRFIPFPKVLMLCEMQSAVSRIWTPIAISITYDDKHYTTGTAIISPNVAVAQLSDICWNFYLFIYSFMLPSFTASFASSVEYYPLILWITSSLA